MRGGVEVCWWCDGWVEARNGVGEGSHAIQCGGIVRGGFGSGGVDWVGKGGFRVFGWISCAQCALHIFISYS